MTETTIEPWPGPGDSEGGPVDPAPSDVPEPPDEEDERVEEPDPTLTEEPWPGPGDSEGGSPD